VTSAVEIARQEWEESHRRVEANAADRPRYRALLDQVAAVTDELRRRVGQTFTLAELAEEYRRADGWALHVLLGDDEDPAVGSPATVAIAQGAAFHLYARGAVDYAP
jgi:hypothetical protein